MMPPVHRRLTPAERSEVEQFAQEAIRLYPDALGSEQFLAASLALHQAQDVPYTWATLAALIVKVRGWGTWQHVALLESGAVEQRRP